MTLVGSVLSLVLTILVPGVLLIVVLKLDWLRGLRIPIDGGARLAGQRVLGDGKTWLGLLLYVVGAALTAAALATAPWAEPVLVRAGPLGASTLGALVGLAYATGELLNSFVKRRLGIPASTMARGPVAHALQRAADLADGAVCACIVFLIIGIDWRVVVVTFVVGLVVHVLTDAGMRLLRLKRASGEGLSPATNDD